jgi:prophage regulatory protein
MHLNHDHQTKGLVRQPTLCAWLDLSRSGLEKLRKKDPTFPKPIKDSDSRQAAVYYVMAEVKAWLEGRIAARDKTTALTPPHVEPPAKIAGV